MTAASGNRQQLHCYQISHSRFNSMESCLSGWANTSCCSHCFSLTHQFEDCELSLSTHGENESYQNRPSRQSLIPKAITHVCYSWNENLKAVSQYPNCRFEHCCYWCHHNPRKHHKAIFCHNRPRLTQQPVMAGPRQ